MGGWVGEGVRGWMGEFANMKKECFWEHEKGKSVSLCRERRGSGVGRRTLDSEDPGSNPVMRC